jgi:branched-subunit amino acid transport protein
MSLVLLLGVAAVTVASRVAALALLPPPRGAAAGLVRRLPAPLFAALAALSVVTSDGGVTDPAMLAAVGCALLSTRWSSLLVTLGAGLGGFLAAGLVW